MRVLNDLRKLTLVFFITLLCLPATARDWSQWRGANRDGRTDSFVAPKTWPKTLKEEWKVTVGVGHSSPVEALGKLYVFARQAEEEVLLCLDAATGKQLWRASYPVAYDIHPAAMGHGKGPKSTPAVSAGRVYTFGISGILSCFDARDGQLKWRADFSRQYKQTSPLYGTAMSPIVENGLVLAHVGGHDAGTLMAFDAATGRVRWTYDGDGPAYSSPVTATLAGVGQLITYTQKQLVGINLADGKPLWQLPAKTGYDTNSMTPVLYKDLIIYAREGQGMAAIRLVKQGASLTPQEVWKNAENELSMNTPVIEGKQLFGLSIKKRGQFFSLDADTGKTLWQSDGRQAENIALVHAGKYLFALTNEAKLFVLPADAKSFTPLAQYEVAKSPTWAHPLVTGHRILVKDETTLTSWAIPAN
ncbi:MAG: PQQ-binding-like beta-propeller repeat protein [Pyrinomonadaceae bacterium]